ncbi:murein hydrolase activator EnvC family protein [Burkholderia sp. TSV86]|uniref:murein hydrolase activator EnvC family protein n=1 Tax=Burkholderia sp. TSV86 TaxID=1385594 RepID=UPI000754225E|nr:hypothetical protein WS68_23800 [Burkholderia sp. TSV86]
MISLSKPTHRCVRKSFTFASRAAGVVAVAMLAACATPPNSAPAAGYQGKLPVDATQSAQSSPQRSTLPDASTPAFAWPVRGPILKPAGNTNGVNIGGMAGEPVKAAAGGVVAYAGSSLRGYGNFVIVKHDDTYLSAYAHNRVLKVKEGDKVEKGQTIAEMGSSDANRVMLHFEIRRNGAPVDPLKYLPPQ